MVALQILVLSVWVRVLVEQQKRAITFWWLLLFFAYTEDEDPPNRGPHRNQAHVLFRMGRAQRIRVLTT